jgi:hypothetical protein
LPVNPVAIGGNNALTAINEENGELDILTAGFVADVQAIGSGYDLTFIAGTAVEGGAVIAKKGNADKFKGTDLILNLDQVTNAKLGFSRNEAAWIVTRQYLLDNGVDSSRITIYMKESDVSELDGPVSECIIAKIKDEKYDDDFIAGQIQRCSFEDIAYVSQEAISEIAKISKSASIILRRRMS